MRWQFGCPKKHAASTTKHKTSSHTLSKIVIKHKATKAELMAFKVMCREAKQAGLSCSYAPKKGKKPTPAHLTLDLSAIARTLVTRIHLPDPEPQIGPDPSANEWKMAAVGYPLWLWTAGPRTVVDRVRAYGVTFTLRATWLSSRFDMGEGHAVTCTKTAAYPTHIEPGAESPTCGYTYLTSSLPKGNYTVSSTTNWRISWRALGVSGSMPGSFTGSRSLPVGELNALVVR